MTAGILDGSTIDNITRARTVRELPPAMYTVAYSTIADLLETRASLTPNAPFLISYADASDTRRELSFAQFNALVNQVAHVLVRHGGVQRGERVATLAGNHLDTVLIYFACWKIGATVAPQNASEDDGRIAFILANAEVRLALVRADYAERWDSIRSAAPGVTQTILLDESFQRLVAAQPSDFTPDDQPDLEDEALLVYTSGTTGAPKGVQLIQYNLLVDARGISQWHQLAPSDRMLCVLPIHHVNGIIVTLLTPLYAGCSVVLTRGFSASSFWQRIAAEGVHVVSLVPTILQFLCEADEDVSGYDLGRFRYCICGAGTLSVALGQRFEQRFGKRVLHGYGLSETTCYSCFLPVDLSDDDHRRWMRDYGYPSIGCPIDPNEMAIHDAAGQEVADGTTGEIVIRGHNVMVGYFKRPDANAETFAHGWFRSGDEGFVQHDAQGRSFFFITGRIKELINRGGVKYSPFEIEEVLLEVPGVRVGLAVAFDNVWYGEEIGAYIVTDTGAHVSAEQVLAHCRARMPFPKCPKVVVFGNDIPVTSTGKYQRLRLKEVFAPWANTQFRDT